MQLFLKFASGPLAFLVLSSIAFDELRPPAHVALAVFGWMVAWWMAQPVPWAVTSLLPLLLFPSFGVMTIGRTAELYGQNIFFSYGERP